MKRLILLISLLLLLFLAACGGTVCVNDGHCDDYEEVLGCQDCTQLLPNSCTMSNGFGCDNFDVIGGSESRVDLSLVNTIGHDIAKANVSLSTPDCDLDEQTINFTDIAAGDHFGPTTFHCIDDLEPETRFHGTIMIKYTLVGENPWHMAHGEITARVNGMGERIKDTIKLGETKKYILDGTEYDVTLIFISKPDQGLSKAKFMVNGEVSSSLTAKESETLGCVKLMVNEVNPESDDATFELESVDHCNVEPPAVYLNDTFEFERYDSSDHSATFLSFETGGIVKISFNTSNRSEIDYKDVLYPVQMVMVDNEYALEIDSSNDGDNDIVVSKNMQFRLGEEPTLKFTNYNESNHTVTLSGLDGQTDTINLTISLDANNNGMFTYNDKSYNVHPWVEDYPRLLLEFDKDNNRLLVLEGGEFTLN